MFAFHYLSAFLFSFPSCTFAYAPKTPALATNWTYSVGTDPWPEYPRPQMTRDRWQSLNGVWSYRNASGLDALNGTPPTGQLDMDVLIPSCLESALSGINGPITTYGSLKYSWFRTEFDVPSDWNSNDIMINFGAIDYEATVFLNGQNVTFHRGGYSRFAADITQAVNLDQSNELLVFVHDPTDSPGYSIPLGKQSLDPQLITYTPCSGIWQQVFIEPVPSDGSVRSLDLAGDMYGQVNITVWSTRSSSAPVQVKVFGDDGNVMGIGRGEADRPFVFNVSNADLWAPEHPNLYNISVTLGNDTVQTYTGFRTIGKGVVDDVVRPLLNGKFYFTLGVLDQGYWPDGIYTPPNYEAMMYDLQTVKNLGLNHVRKHQKVEMDLYYHACDQIGLLVMQDMPAMRPLPNSTQQDAFVEQLIDLVMAHRSFPSIYTWTIYNEGGGQLPGAEIELTSALRTLDPTRLIDSNSGWVDSGAGDYSDNHHYMEPQCGTPWYSHNIPDSPYDPTRIGFQGEFGGIGTNVSIEHLWSDPRTIQGSNNYELDSDLDAFNYRSRELLQQIVRQIEFFACSGTVWTQLTDVEGELDGLMTYDRNILRANITQWNEDARAIYEAAGRRGGSQGR